MSDPFSVERLLGTSATSAVATAGIAGMLAAPGRHFGGGDPVLTDEQLRPLVLDYLQRAIGTGQAASGGIDVMMMYTEGGHIHPQYMLEAKTPPMMTPPVMTPPVTMGALHIRHDTDFDLLETCRSDVASVARFARRVDCASYYFAAAFDEAERSESWRPKLRKGVRISKAYRSTFGRLAQASFQRWRDVRSLLVLDWTPSANVEPLCRAAFWTLCELTPADTQLKALFVHDEGRARHELVRHVDVVAEQLEMTTRLAEDLSAESVSQAAADDTARLDAVQSELLGKAGDRLTLTEAAGRLGLTRQALHKKIKTGAALGLMIGETFVLPSAQLIKGKNGMAVVAHLRDVLSLFTESGAGNWSALQFLVEPDPALGGTVPLDRLKAGDVGVTVAAARAYLGLDDG